MSGEEGSASMTNSQINMTQHYPPTGSTAPFRAPVPAISPSLNKHNITNDAANSSIGPNPFATQAMIGLTQLPLSSQASQSHSRVYQPHPSDHSTAGPPQHPDEQDQMHRDQYGNYVAWTGRNHYQEEEQSYQTEGVSSSQVSYRDNKGEVIYHNGGPNVHYPNMINETQDRASIASKSGFLNVNDITGITRGGEVTAEGFNTSYINGTVVYDRPDIQK